MKIITREHLFSNRLTRVEKGRKYFYLLHEKSLRPLKVKITPKGIKAFDEENWNYFICLEAKTLGGE